MYVHGVTDDGVTLRQAIGAKVRELRERNGDRQDDVADAARGLGLSWTRSKVGALENGDKAIPVEELVLLPLILATETGAPSLIDLLPSGKTWIRLGDNTRVRADALRRIVLGEDFQVDDIAGLGFPDGPIDMAEMIRNAKASKAMVTALWPGANVQGLMRARKDSLRDAEQVAGRRLHAPAHAVSLASWSRWGRGLTDERDARVAEKVPDAAQPRTIQALRGRVTRTLYDELRPVLDAYRNGA